MIARVIGGIVAGYLVYAISAMLLVGPVMASQGATVVVVGLVVLALIGCVAGLLAALVAGERRQLAASVAAVLVALASIVNLVVGLGAESTWFKVGTLLLTVPAMLLVGRSRNASRF